MTIFKRCTALALAGLLVLGLAACGRGEGPAQSGSAGEKGRYVEADITPPGFEAGRLSSFVNAAGSIICYNADLSKRFESADGGESWQETPGPGAAGGLGNIGNFALLPDGSLLAAKMKAADGSLESLVRISPEGEVAPFPVEGLDEAVAENETTYVNMLKVFSEDRLMLGYAYGDFDMAFGGTEAEESAPGEAGDDSDDAPEENGQMAEGMDVATGVAPMEAGGGESAPDAQAPPEAGAESDESAEPGQTMVVSDGQHNFAGLIDLADGSVAADFSDWYGVSAAAAAGTLYLMDYNGEILQKSLADGSAKGSERTVPVGDFTFTLTLAADEDGNIYVLDGNRVLKTTPGGETETLMDGSAYSFAGANQLAETMQLMENGDILMNISQDGSGKLYRYHYDEDATLDEAAVLRVWSLRENALVRNAVSALREQNPGAVVEYEVALSDESAMTAEDAIKNLNTRLLGGDGPDVLMLDGCPAESYAARGMLADLAKTLDTAAVFPGIADPFYSGDSLYYLPMNFKAPLVLGSKENLEKLTGLSAFADAVEQGSGLPPVGNDDDVFTELPEAERPVLAPETLREVFDLLWNSGASAVVGSEGLDSAALTELLAALKTVSDKYELGKGEGVTSGAIGLGSSDGTVITAKGSAVAYLSGRSQLGAYTVEDLQMLQFLMEPAGSEYMAFPGLSEGAFLPTSLAAINADTQKMDLATAFLSGMLSDEVQATRSGNGLPVTQAGMEEQISKLDEMMRENQNTGFDFDWAPLVETAQTPQMLDESVTEMVWQQAQGLCAGDTDLESAVKNLEQNLKNYLAERQ